MFSRHQNLDRLRLKIAAYLNEWLGYCVISQWSVSLCNTIEKVWPTIWFLNGSTVGPLVLNLNITQGWRYRWAVIAGHSHFLVQHVPDRSAVLLVWCQYELAHAPVHICTVCDVMGKYSGSFPSFPAFGTQNYNSQGYVILVANYIRNSLLLSRPLFSF